MYDAKITAEPGLPFTVIEREFDAPAELLFRAHTEADLLAQWLGPHGSSMKVDELDARDGGKWSYSSGDGQYVFRGVFHGTPSVEGGIVQTFEFMGAPGNVLLEQLTFEERDGKTLLRGHSVAQTVEARDAMIESGMEVGVNEGYEKLDALVKTLAPVA